MALCMPVYARRSESGGMPVAAPEFGSEPGLCIVLNPAPPTSFRTNKLTDSAGDRSIAQLRSFVGCRTWHTNSSIARGGLVGAGHSGSIRGVARISAGLSCVNRPCRSEPTSLISGNKSHGSARAHRVRTAWITARGDSNGGNPQAAKSSMPAPSNRESRAARACDHQAARAFRSCIRSRPSSVGTRDRAVGQNTRRMPNCIWRGFAPGIWRLL